MNYIYTISNPQTDEVFYVGRTKNPRDRFKQHVGNSKTKVYKSILELKEKGIKPLFTIIEECKGFASEREDFWINYYIEQGASLVNYCADRMQRDDFLVKVNDGINYLPQTVTEIFRPYVKKEYSEKLP